LKPFEEYTLFISREEPTLYRIPNLYLQLKKLLTSIIKKEGKYVTYNPSLVLTTQKGLNKFNRYYKEIKKNDIYWIAYYLDPRVKTR
jgi:hypothetical protein